ncbi:E6-like protein [human papillomavirus 214]|nr:E6-like protein [human papillomavirus 214]
MYEYCNCIISIVAGIYYYYIWYYNCMFDKNIFAFSIDYLTLILYIKCVLLYLKRTY